MPHLHGRDRIAEWLAYFEWAFPLRGRWLVYFLAVLCCVGLVWFWTAAPQRLLAEVGGLVAFLGLLCFVAAAVYRIEEWGQVGRPGRGVKLLRVATALLVGGALVSGLARVTKNDLQADLSHQLDAYATGFGR